MLFRLLKPDVTAIRFWVGVAFALAGGAILFRVTSQAIESDAEIRFKSMARVGSYTIGARIKSYTDVLRGTAGLFRANPDATEEQFRDYVDQLNIKENFPGIEVINYARVVTDQQRPAIEQQIRERLRDLGAPPRGFSIKPRGPDATYTVIIYIEPRSALWFDKLGMDLEARQYTRTALATSRDNDIMTASGTRVPILSGPNQHGLAMRMPVYRVGMPGRTAEQRRAAYIGSVGIGFGVQNLIAGVLERLPIKGTRLTVSDVTPVPVEPGLPAQSMLLFDSGYGVPVPAPSLPVWGNAQLHVQLPIEFNQRKWIADFSIPRHELYTYFDAFYPWLAALAGSVSAALLYTLFQTLAASRRHAIRMAEDMTRELRASQSKLQASHEKLRRLAAHTEQIKERERKRIAREIHDDLGQSLLAVRIDAEMLTARTRDTHSRLHARAKATLQQIDSTIRSVRQIINDLRPNVLDLGLNAAVDWQVTEFERRTGIECYLIEDDNDLRVDDQCATAFFRILQESLNNIARHAHATEVRIELELKNFSLSMAIRDNGIGLQPGSRNRPGSFGLVGIEERVNILGGTFSIKSEPGAGTVLLVKIPIVGQPPPRPALTGKAPSEKLTA